MLKNISKLEVVIGEKVYQMICDSDSPLEHVKEALFQFQKYVGQVEDAIMAATAKAKKEQEQAAQAIEDQK